ncbi:hypothetical protein QAD02_003131 [Eretmocerus hayati]|uniref:Uncharacterized protein n=1 Tax=Eretmocerus hayati TaxID=131215 RepID=A0ACC2NLA4_9HYME|nr:hypothetical protein QAD02_003131 [Eretmocerus hayati]
MFADINEVTPYPEPRYETKKVSYLVVDHPYRVKGGNLIKTKFGMKIVLELKGDDGKEFTIYIPKALNDVMLKNSNHSLDIFNKRGTLVTHVGNTKLKFEAGVTKKPAPVKKIKRKIAKIIESDDEVEIKKGGKKKTPPEKISKKSAKDKFIDLRAKEAEKDKFEVEKDDSGSGLELSD